MVVGVLVIGGACMLNAIDRDLDRSEKTKKIYVTYMEIGVSEELVDEHVNGLAKVAGITPEQALDSIGIILRAITTTEFEREFETVLRRGTGVLQKKHNLTDKQIKFVEGAGREMQTNVKTRIQVLFQRKNLLEGKMLQNWSFRRDFLNRVKKIGANLYRVGGVTIDSKLQVAVFPAEVNQIIGLIEYALVTEQGKTHESFLSTKIKPRDVHVAMLLLGVKPPGNVSV